MEEKELFSHLDEMDKDRLEMIFKSRELASRKKTGEATPAKFKIHPQYMVLGLIVMLTLSAGVLFPGDPAYMALSEKNLSPGSAYFFGTDALGRDVFGMVLHGGQISLLVGLFSTLISTGIALLVGSAAAILPNFFARLISRFIELFLSIPSILFMISLQSLMRGNTLFTLSISIGLSSWMTMAKMVSAKILQIKGEEYIYLARYHGAGYLYLMKKHYLPAVIPVVSCMAFSGLGHAMVAEATLSFLGIGFPVDTVTWGSLLSLSGQALMTKAWWVIVIPGMVLVITVVALIETGEILRKRNEIGKHL